MSVKPWGRGRRVVGDDRADPAALARVFAQPQARTRPAVPAGHPVRALHGASVAAPAVGARLRLRSDVLATPGAMAGRRGLRPTTPDTPVGIPLNVVTTAANVNDVTQTLALVGGIPPGRRSGRPPPQAPRRRTRRQGLRQQSQPARAPTTRDPAGPLPQGPARHPGPGQAPLGRVSEVIRAHRVSACR